MPGGMIKNPFTALFETIVWTAFLCTLLSIPIVIFRYLAMPTLLLIVYGVIAFAAAGAVAGRSGTFNWAALPAAFLGAFLGYTVFMTIFVPPLSLLYALIHAAIAGLSGWAAATVRMTSIKARVHLESEEKLRCRVCGVRVGPRARKCWSCRASLERSA